MKTRVTKTTTTTTTVRRTSHGRTYLIWPLAILCACIALLLAIISIASSGWNGRYLLKNCDGCIGTIILSFIGIFFIVLAIISTILFAKRLITSFSLIIKLSSVLLFILAGIFIIFAYTTYIRYSSNNYSYYLMAIAAIFTFISANLMSFWLGLNWIVV